jgi:16S rRNA (uracil1498-N3)-methyltransferase
MAEGEVIDIVDGAGRRVTGRVAAVVGKHTLAVEAVEIVDEQLPALRVTVVQALAKGDRGELAVGQLTEIGADEIVPWSAEHSVVHWRGDRADKSAQRWTDAITAAAKQSRRARFPVLAPLATTAQVSDRIAAAAVAVVLHEAATDPISSISVPAGGELLVVVGPEGGISPGELTDFTIRGARVTRLGPTVLRTSSAGLAAVAVLLSTTTRWSTEAVGG